MTESQANTFIQALQNPQCYPHPVGNIELIETHISWVLLAGEFAYKIKKPVNFGFLDFSTLAKREHFCREELRLNQRLAAQLYITVVPISGTATTPELDGAGPVFEYAIKMHRFPQQQLWDVLAKAGELPAAPLGDLAERIAHFHLTAATAPPDSSLGTPQQVRHWYGENFGHIEPHLTTTEDQQQLGDLQLWGNQQFNAIQTHLNNRKSQGCIKECHGDLHLRNIVTIANQAVCFDCIEFNDELRWVDVLSEVAFLFMDMDSHGYPALAYEFLNHYLQITGDYQGLSVFRYYLVYRALVRAKVTVLKHTAQPDWPVYRHFIGLTQKYRVPPKPKLMITVGCSGSGKSYWARQLAGPLSAIQLRSDVERKRLFKLQARERSGSPLTGGIYSQGAGELTYGRLAKCTEQLIQANYSVIVDATFLKSAQREVFRCLADQLSVELLILEFTAPLAILRDRVSQREILQEDASEAGEKVLEHQLTQTEPLTREEQSQALAFQTHQTLDLDALVNSIEQYFVLDRPS